MDIMNETKIDYYISQDEFKIWNDAYDLEDHSHKLQKLNRKLDNINNKIFNIYYFFNKIICFVHLLKYIDLFLTFLN